MRLKWSFPGTLPLPVIFKQPQQCEWFCFIANPAGNWSETSRRYLPQSRQVFDTGLQHTHGGALCLSHTAATVQPCPAGCPLAPLSCEKLFRGRREAAPESKVWHLTGTRQTRCYTLHFWSAQPSFPPAGFHHLIFPQYKCQAGAARKYLHAKTHHGLCVRVCVCVCACVDCGWWCFAHTKRHLSGGRQGKKRKGGGWLFCILGGLPPLVGKLNIYILQLELLFSHFIFHNIDYTLHCGVECFCMRVALRRRAPVCWSHWETP